MVEFVRDSSFERVEMRLCGDQAFFFYAKVGDMMAVFDVELDESTDVIKFVATKKTTICRLYKQLERVRISNLDDGRSYTDLTAVVWKVFLKQTKKGSNERTVIVCDDSYKTIKLALWNELAEIWPFNRGDIIDIKNVEVTTYRGVYQLNVLGIHQISKTRKSIRRYEIEKWWHNTAFEHEPLCHITSLDHILSSSARRDVKQYYVVRGAIGVDGGIDIYPSCNNHIAEAIFCQNNNRWECMECFEWTKEPYYRYRFNVRDEGDTSTTWMNDAGCVGLELFGLSAKQFHNIKVLTSPFSL
jgi:hypothetical protein